MSAPKNTRVLKITSPATSITVKQGVGEGPINKSDKNLKLNMARDRSEQPSGSESAISISQ